MNKEIEGIPNKPQAICIITLVIYVITTIVFLCINAPGFKDISERLRYCLPLLIGLVILFCITFLVCYYFPNIKELKSKFIKEYSFLEEYGYHCKSSFYSKKDKIIQYRYVHDKFSPIIFVSYIRRGTVPYFVTENEECVNIWHFLEYLDEDSYNRIKEEDDAFKHCMEMMIGYMETKYELFSKELEICLNLLTFHLCDMPDSRPAEYCLGCYDGSCFVDFNITNGLVFLERISFDGFGCFEISNPDITLSLEESEVFQEEMKKNNFSQKIIRPFVLKLINLNKDLMCSDVFDQYPLLKITTQEK